MKIILASKSPRRKQLLTSIGLKYEVKESNFEELSLKIPAEELVILNAKGKARDVAKNFSNAIVIGVDTIGSYKHHILEKAKNDKDALRILKILNNTTHDVLSGVCVINTKTKEEICHLERTKVTFCKMTLKEIKDYILTGEAKDKAASFAIQGKGSLFIKKIDGCFFNVMGLPVYSLGQILKKMEVKII